MLALLLPASLAAAGSVSFAAAVNYDADVAPSRRYVTEPTQSAPKVAVDELWHHHPPPSKPERPAGPLESIGPTRDELE